VLCHWLYGLDCPAPARAALLSGPGPGRLAALALEALLAGGEPGTDAPWLVSAWRELRYQAALGGAGAQLRSMVTPQSADQRLVPLPDRLASLHYVLRPFLLAWRHRPGAGRARRA
jgi:hypothetical protein